MSTYYDQSIQAENERLRRELQDAHMMVAALLATAGGAVRVDRATLVSVPRGVEIQRWTDPDGAEVFAIAIETWPPNRGYTVDDSPETIADNHKALEEG